MKEDRDKMRSVIRSPEMVRVWQVVTLVDWMEEEKITHQNLHGRQVRIIRELKHLSPKFYLASMFSF